MDGRHHRGPRMLAEGQRQPVEVVVHQLELTRPGQCVRYVQRLPDPAVQSGVLSVAMRADTVEDGRRHRIERREQGDVDPPGDQPLREQAGDRFPRPVVLGRCAPGNGREHGDLHRGPRGRRPASPAHAQLPRERAGQRASGCGGVPGRRWPAAGLQPRGAWPADAAHPAHALEHPDDRGRRVDLAAVDAVPGTGRVGVVHVVPAFAERQHGQRPQVGGPVVRAGGERPVAEHVAQRVHAPGDVLEQEYADQAGPQHGQQRTASAADHPAQAKRQRQRRGAQRQKRLRHPAHGRIGQQVGRVPLLGGRIIPEQPPGVRVQDATQQPGRAGAVPVRRVRVTRPVREGVVAPVGGHPADHVALEAHRGRDRERHTQGRPRGEAPVGKAAVETHRDPEPGQQVEERPEEHVGQADAMAPQQVDSGHQPDEGAHHDHPYRGQLDRPLARRLDGRDGAGKRADAVIGNCGHVRNHRCLAITEVQRVGL